MYHSAGINFINWLVSEGCYYCHFVPNHSTQSTTGMILAVFPPSSPAVIPSFDAVFDGFVATHAAYGFVPPIFLEVSAYSCFYIDSDVFLRNGVEIHSKLLT